MFVCPSTIGSSNSSKEQETDDGKTYFYNENTGQTSWEDPNAKADEWLELETDEGKTYYYNERTGKTAWDNPSH